MFTTVFFPSFSFSQILPTFIPSRLHVLSLSSQKQNQEKIIKAKIKLEKQTPIKRNTTTRNKTTKDKKQTHTLENKTKKKPDTHKILTKIKAT